MKLFLLYFFVILFIFPVVFVEAGNFDSPYSPPFTTGNEFSARTRIPVSRKDFDKPVSQDKVYFHLEPVVLLGELPMLDLIVTRNRPCTDVQKAPAETRTVEMRLDENTVKSVNAGQIVPYIVLWQIRNKEGKVLRQWEPDFRDRLRCDGDKHFRTIYSLPEDDLRNSFLLVFFEKIGDGTGKDGMVFEIDLRDLDWPKLK